MNIKILLLVSIFTVFTAFSCASREERIELIKQEVEAILKKTDIAEMITGLFVEGENRSNFRAYFDNEDLIFINEDLSKGFWSGVTYHYYLKDDELIYLSQKEVGFEGPDSKNKRTIVIEIYFDGEEVLDAVKKFEGQYTDIPREEIDLILSHAKKIKEVAKNLNPKLN
ncbi:hypothetical protein [Ignavibacterium sp.]|uniref:hypothetical protein n=1 Tax=Ignavibacterium sp. TaxID=2651167 RepID=UPI00307E3CD6